MTRIRATEPDAPVSAAPHAERALAECGVVIDARVHSGPIADVYRGRIAESGETVAVKLTGAASAAHPGASRLVAREHEALAALEHPSIVRPLRFAQRGGAAVLALEHLPGGDLVPFRGEPLIRWIRAASSVASALRAVHAAGLVHGDVKARNVLLSSDGTAKLIDFGSSSAIGRPRPSGARTRAHEPLRFVFERALPEQDVYAFAVLLYELAAGRLPRPPAPAAALPAGTQALRALRARVEATLDAADPAGVGTLLEFADVLESVHAEAAGGEGVPPSPERAGENPNRAPGTAGAGTVMDD